MRKIFGILTVAGLTILGAGTASAQGIDVRIGHGGVRLVQDHHYGPRYRERIVERRVMRPASRRTVCRTVVREHMRRNGVVVRRPVEECRTIVGSRRSYID